MKATMGLRYLTYVQSYRHYTNIANMNREFEWHVPNMLRKRDNITTFKKEAIKKSL